MADTRTGWPPGMLQDDDRRLSRALASKPDARMHAREAAVTDPAQPVEPLFRDRTPEAAARQLAVVLASSVEFHMATLDRLEMRKSSSKYDRERQRDIINTLVFHCAELNVRPSGISGRPTPRLADAIAAWNRRDGSMT